MMKRHTTAIFLCLALAIGPHLMACSKTQTPQLVAVTFRADWCGSRQKMGNSFTHLQNKFNGERILLITLAKTKRMMFPTCERGSHSLLFR